MDKGEVFFVVACSPPQGINAMIRRIQGQLMQCTRLQESDLSFAISPVSQELLDKDNPLPYERQLGIVGDTLEKRIREKTNQRSASNGEKENTCG